MIPRPRARGHDSSGQGRRHHSHHWHQLQGATAAFHDRMGLFMSGNGFSRQDFDFIEKTAFVRCFCLLLWLANCSHGNLSVISRNVHIESIVTDKNNINKLKAEQINTEAMAIASTSAETSAKMLLQAYDLDRSNWMISANLANVYSNIEQQNLRDFTEEERQKLDMTMHGI